MWDRTLMAGAVIASAGCGAIDRPERSLLVERCEALARTGDVAACSVVERESARTITCDPATVLVGITEALARARSLRAGIRRVAETFEQDARAPLATSDSKPILHRCRQRQAGRCAPRIALLTIERYERAPTRKRSSCRSRQCARGRAVIDVSEPFARGSEELSRHVGVRRQVAMLGIAIEDGATCVRIAAFTCGCVLDQSRRRPIGEGNRLCSCRQRHDEHQKSSQPYRPIHPRASGIRRIPCKDVFRRGTATCGDRRWRSIA